jgi:hypothetical protein
MTRYRPSRNYLTAGLVAIAMAALSAWLATQWTVSIVPAVLFCVSAGLLLFLAFRPPVEIHPQQLRIGTRVIPWGDIQAVDVTGWTSPLILLLTLADRSRLLLIYPGDLDTSMSLLRQIRKMSHAALIDGVPYAEFWGAAQSNVTTSRKRLPAPRYPVLRQEDEEEVERLYQRLKTVGHLDPKSGSEES